MQERRKAVRSKTYFGGVVAFNRRRSTLDCLVRNFSPNGAKLTFSNMAVQLPDKFDLLIERKERSFRARVAWQGADEIGVAFLPDAAGAEPIPLEWARRLRDCETEKAALRRRIDQLSTAD